MTLSLNTFEFKKIISNKAVKIVYVLAFLYIIVAVSSIVNSESHWQSTDSGTVEKINGISAIKGNKSDIKEIKGPLDSSKIRDVINYFHELKDDPNNLNQDDSFTDIVIAKYWKPYLNLQSLIGMAYSDPHIFDYTIIDKLSPDSSEEFYSKRIDKINDFLNFYYENPQFTETDAQEILKKANSLETPIYYDYSDGWIRLIENFFSLNLIIMFLLCFSVCSIFTEDIQNGMAPIVLSTINGRTKLALSKIKASIIFATNTYLVLNFIFAGLILSFYGTSGWNCPIQIKSSYLLSIYNLKFYQAYILGLIVGLSVCLFMVMITLLLGTILKKAFLTISSAIAFILVPLLVNTEPLSKIPANLIELLPIKALNYSHTLVKQSLYSIFGIEILRAYITPIILLIIGIAIIPLIIRIYNTREI